MLSDKCVYSVIKWLNNSNKKIGKKFDFFLKKKNRKEKKRGQPLVPVRVTNRYQRSPAPRAPPGPRGGTFSTGS